ncbi:MAG: Bug family tripartite tricarboxylate transporter substrate binding protein [Rhodospirillales bacterium]
MPLTRRLAAVVATLIALGLAPSADAWPDRPIRLVIPGPPGGAADIMARNMADDVSRSLGQPLVIEPRPGTGGNLATEMVARAPADGYTLLFGDIGPLALSKGLFETLPFDPVRDFEPVGQIALFPWVVVVHPSVPANTLAELFDLARRTPGGLSFATPGVGTPMHLTGAILSNASGATFVHVPYRGGAPATTDVIAGQVTMGILGLPPAAQHLKSGALKGIGVSTAARAPAVPDVATLKEGGLADFDASVWYGVLAPRGTDAAIVARIHAAFAAALANPAVRERLAAQGVVPTLTGPAEFRAHIAAEIERWTPIVRASGAKAE